MDYHSDRFNDFSLMLYKGNDLFALLPANSKGSHVYSHQGLSYGGLLLKKDCKFEDVLEAFKILLKYLNENNFDNLELKLLPKIYHMLPSDEMDFLLFKTDAQIIRKDISTVIDFREPLKITSSNRKRNLKKAISNQVVVKEVEDCEAFFNMILIPNLKERHEALPTHNVEDINSLKTKFPKHIRQFNAYHDDVIIAGVTVFETDQVVHAQYISTLDSKKDLAGLDAIFDQLIHTEFKHKRYFSFGISNENQGQQVNRGLLKWKESFGARAISHDFYKMSTKNYNRLNDIWL
ncbi:GNAT family N-acetyltransferase [Psychroserpens jangbogonensis]|uniref:GNAT family N-acetyltransferase n=1 Tax=Psychroserpens jangbogonensis TaxID=1484460 RepID=UPI000A6EA1AA|nr:GNAT family N-acetyltransferase [Psychroserpens jangbogonensis]